MLEVWLLIANQEPIGLFDGGRVAGVYATEQACRSAANTQPHEVIMGDQVVRFHLWCSKRTIEQ